jgi:hypothetical protein
LGFFARVAFTGDLSAFPFLFLIFLSTTRFPSGRFRFLTATAAVGGVLSSTRPRFDARPVLSFPLFVDRRYELRS